MGTFRAQRSRWPLSRASLAGCFPAPAMALKAHQPKTKLNVPLTKPKAKASRRILSPSAPSAVTAKATKRKLSHPAQSRVSKRPCTQRTLSKKVEVSEEACGLAKANRLTHLERRSVSKAVENQYAGYYLKFANFCKEHGLQAPPNALTDEHLAEYMDHIFWQGKGLSEGEKVLASVEYQHHSLKGALNRSRRALKGWRKERPPASRVPLPRLIAYGMSMAMVAKNQREMGLKLILDFDTYMRPGESQDLKGSSLVPPVKGAGPQYRWHRIVVRPFDEGRPDKVGVFDNSLALNSQGRVWLGEVLAAHVKTLPNKGKPIFSFTSTSSAKSSNRWGKRWG